MGSTEYVNEYERDVNVLLRYVGLVDTARWQECRVIRKTEWHSFVASGLAKEGHTEGLAERNAREIKRVLSRARQMESGYEDGRWFVRFKMNAETLSKLLA